MFACSQGRLAVCILLGMLLAISIWLGHSVANGHDILSALRGRVDDEPGVLQAFVTLGMLCGAAVGLASAVIAVVKYAISNSTTKESAIPGHPPSR